MSPIALMLGLAGAAGLLYATTKKTSTQTMSVVKYPDGGGMANMTVNGREHTIIVQPPDAGGNVSASVIRNGVNVLTTRSKAGSQTIYMDAALASPEMVALALSDLGIIRNGP